MFPLCASLLYGSLHFSVLLLVVQNCSKGILIPVLYLYFCIQSFILELSDIKNEECSYIIYYCNFNVTVSCLSSILYFKDIEDYTMGWVVCHAKQWPTPHKLFNQCRANFKNMLTYSRSNSHAGANWLGKFTTLNGVTWQYNI